MPNSEETDPGADARREAAAQALVDFFYTSIGLGILAVNKAQVARRSVEAELANAGIALPSGSLTDACDTGIDVEPLLRAVRQAMSQLDDRVDGLEDRVSELFDQLEPALLPPACDVVGAVRQLAGDHAVALRSILGLRAH